MAKHRLKLKDLKKILRSFGIGYEEGRGKGSHLLFIQERDGGTYTYPVPDVNDVLPCYVKECRKKFQLLKDDGVTDGDFFGRK